jgi:tetratricopeptide (TPR) repeat protein
MNRKLNFKFLLILIGILVVSTVGTIALHEFQVRRLATYLLVTADKDEAAGKLEKAATSLELYVGFRKDDVKALVKYGNLLDKKAKSARQKQRAVAVLELALRKDAEQMDVVRKVAEIHSQLGNVRLAEPYWSKLFLKNPKDGMILGKLAAVPLVGKRYGSADLLKAKNSKETAKPIDKPEKYIEELGKKDAIEILRDAIELSPNEIDLYLSLTRALRESPAKLENIANATIDRMVAANRDNVRAYTERIANRIRHPRDKDREGDKKDRHVPDIEADIETAQKLKPDDLDLALISSAYSLGMDRRDEALAQLKKAAELHPTEVRVHRTLANVYTLMGQRSEALDAFRRAVEVAPDDEELLFAYTEALLESRMVQDAEAMIASMKAKKQIPLAIGYLEAMVSYANKRWADAAKSLERYARELNALPEGTKPIELERKAYYVIGLCNDQLAQPEQSLVAYRKALIANPGSPFMMQTRLNIASALAATNKIDEAIREYKALSMDTPGVRLTLTRLRLSQNQQLPEDAREWKDIETNIQVLEAANPTSLDTLSLRVQMAVIKKQVPEVRALLAKARLQNPDKVAPMLAMANLEMTENHKDEALKIINEAGVKFGDTYEVRLERIRYWNAIGGEAGLAKIGELRQDLDKFKPGEKAALLEALSMANRRLGKSEDSTSLIAESATMAPDDIRLRLRQLSQALDSGRDQVAIDVIKELRRIEGEEGIFWRLGDAQRLIVKDQRAKTTAELPKARQLLNEVIAKKPNDADAHAWLGFLDDMEKKPQQAIEHYKVSFKAGAKHDFMLRRLAALLYESRDLVEANKVLLVLEGIGATTSNDRKLLAEVAVGSKDKQRALTLIKKAVETRSKDINDFIWQCRMYSALENWTDAQAAGRRAVAISESSAAAQLFLIQALISGGEVEKAKEQAKQARKAIPEEYRLELAMISATIRDNEDAGRRFAEAIQKKPDDLATLRESARFLMSVRAYGQAETVLRKLLTPEVKATPSLLTETRRNLALALLFQRRVAGVKEALTLIDKNITEGPASRTDQLIRAQVLAAVPGRQKESLALFDQLRAAQTLSPDHSLIVARMMESEGKWSEARQIALSLIGGVNPPYDPMAWYIAQLLKRKDYIEANVWVNKLATVYPKLPEVSLFKSRVMHGQKKTPEAVAVLEKEAKDNPSFIPNVVVELEKLNQYGPAIALMTEYVKTNTRPEAKLMLAEVLSRGGKLDESLEICEKAVEASEPTAVASTLSTICESAMSKLDAPTRARMIKILEPIAAKNPKQPLLTMTIAQIHLVDNHFKEAEAAYRRTMEISPDQSAILNNYAWMLAFTPGRDSDALAVIEKAIALEGTEPHLLDTRGIILLHLGKAKEALADFTASIVGAPHDIATVTFHKALAEVALNQNIKANETLNAAKALGFKPESLHKLEIESYNKLLDAVGGK